MPSPADLKVYLACISAGTIITAIPFQDKISLAGTISPIFIKLIYEIHKKNSFFLKELINKSPSSWIQHPWIITIIIMMMWGGMNFIQHD